MTTDIEACSFDIKETSIMISKFFCSFDIEVLHFFIEVLDFDIEETSISKYFEVLRYRCILRYRGPGHGGKVPDDGASGTVT